MEERDEIAIGLADKTGALLMINKKERMLIREILSVTLKSSAAKEWIIKKFGREYIRIGEKLLTVMGDKQSLSAEKDHQD
jgi:hypothetical protein